MSDPADTLYREVILDHARRPRNAAPLQHPHRRARAANPLCGDELELTLELDGGAIRGIGVLVRGCAIAQAAASLMSEAVRGRSLPEADALGRAFRERMEGARDDLPEALEALKPLEAVRDHRSRIPCTLLAWQALRDAADTAPDAGG